MLAVPNYNYKELAESNIDWSGTSAIYVDETDTQPLSSKNKQQHGFCGRVTIPIHSQTIAFCRKTTNDGHYRYFSIDESPILKIEFDYIYQQDCQHYDNGDLLPFAVKLQWEFYPKEFLIYREDHLEWLSKKCNERLEEENKLLSMCTSYSVVELCSFDAMNYWETLHQSYGYRLLLIPQEMDRLYHSNLGTLVHPKEEGQRIQNETSRTKTSPPSDVQDFGRWALIRCWKKLYTDTCPICFDSRRCDDGVIIPCGHFFCNDCWNMYMAVKVGELPDYRVNPFLCPVEKCRKELSIDGIVKQFLSKEDYDKVLRWKYNIDFPPCYSLDRCLSKACCANTQGNETEEEEEKEEEVYMRRSPASKNTNFSTFMFCKECNKEWCELCLKRIRDGESQKKHREVCESQMAFKFCRRYLRASEELKRKCEAKFPWISSYARFRQMDTEAISWILENGQWCPNCNTGVERSEGCFHMKCINCNTHFCYECGQELFPPYYGTHHCWEENDFDEDFFE